MFVDFIESYVFWYLEVPLASAVVAVLYNLLSKRNDEKIWYMDFLVGIDLAVGAFGSNLAFAAARTSKLLPGEAALGFLIVTLCLLIILGLNSAFLRFTSWRTPWRVAVSNVFGMAALIFSFIIWVT